MSSYITASPLTWPEGWPRTKTPESSRFGHWSKPVSIAKGRDEVLDQLRMMGILGDSVIISTNLRLRQDNLPYSNQKQPDDKGVSVWFTQDNQQKVIALDKYNRIADNLWAVAKTIEAMRGIERWGGGQFLDRVFTGFTALPGPEANPTQTWKEYFSGFDMIPKNLAQLKIAYKTLARDFHPDKPGGSGKKMTELNKFYMKAERELGGL